MCCWSSCLLFNGFPPLELLPARGFSFDFGVALWFETFREKRVVEMATKKRRVVTASLNEQQISEYEKAKAEMRKEMYSDPEKYEIKDSEFIKYLIWFYLQEKEKKGGEKVS